MKTFSEINQIVRVQTESDRIRLMKLEFYFNLRDNNKTIKKEREEVLLRFDTRLKENKATAEREWNKYQKTYLT